MLPSWLDPDLFAVVFLGGALPLLGLAALLTRRGAQHPLCWSFAIGASAALAVGMALAGMPRGFWLPSAVLAVLCAAFQALRSDRLVRAVAALLELFRRPALQAGFLVAIGPALTAAWVGWILPGTDPWQPPPNPLQPEPSLRATTDAGRPVPLYRRAGPALPADVLAGADLTTISLGGLGAGVIRTGAASDDYDCHGWVFTGGRAWLVGPDVPAILRDNRYYPTADPRPGDLAVYWRGDGTVSHTGLVRAACRGTVPLVESKWAAGGRFVSAATGTPYGTPTYYHSPRRGHLLRGLDGQGDEGAPAVTAE